MTTPTRSERRALADDVRWRDRNRCDHLAARAAFVAHGFCVLGGLQDVGWRAKRCSVWVQARIEAMSVRHPEIVTYGRETKCRSAAPRALFHTPLSAPAQFVGHVDATHERTTPCPRTLAEAFGAANAGGVIVPMLHPDTLTDKADRIVVRASALAAIALVPILIWTRSP